MIRLAALYFLRSLMAAVAWASMTSVGATSGLSLSATTPISPRNDPELEPSL